MEHQQGPILSIIVCTYNRAAYIESTLKHLIEQDIDKRLIEILIINNNSTDKTEEICLHFMATHPQEPIHYVVEKHQGHSYARNRGIQESKGGLIAFIDDDAFVEKNFSKNIIQFFKEYPQAKVIGGKIIPVYESKKPKWMSTFLLPLVSALDMGDTIKPFKGRKFPIGANVTFRRDVFDQYGYFNVALGRKGSGLAGGDEKELVLRLKADQTPIYYVPHVVVQHVIPDKRLSQEYIKGLAIGVGQSEKERLKKKPLSQKISRAMEEILKIGATAILFVLYSLKLQFPKAIMLVKFRMWVMQGFFNLSA